ncbi:nicotinamide mononucleotide transporter [Lutibacter sp. Hel_I_33_5]|uniref:nicotinamide riboside transporter PnuC n=1 Tax=Lutibacter sp. Hel_I_33_5 TaxID=1566289 RepID=UPI0011A130EB|nr:nicotinamide riboside transporter PnuC [Lutibacter sp. Hel_I_33_5]TVZ56094.1 nicotinamide mononucleotide transporter [Lutibacter sp. Hel_I_33_5]
MNQLFDFFLNAYQNTPTSFIILEAVAFVFGIASVWYAKKENILVYPTGLIATIITVYLLYKAEYFGDMMMNFYYSVMSIYGWWNWSRKKNNKVLVPISRTTSKEKIIGIILAIITMIVTYGVYRYFGNEIKTENYLDIFTSGIFFTAMWFMANKKLENWTLWIFADLITVPLYAYRGLGMLSLQYLIFTILAIQGYITWKKSLVKNLST